MSVEEPPGRRRRAEAANAEPPAAGAGGKAPPRNRADAVAGDVGPVRAGEALRSTGDAPAAGEGTPGAVPSARTGVAAPATRPAASPPGPRAAAPPARAAPPAAPVPERAVAPAIPAAADDADTGTTQLAIGAAAGRPRRAFPTDGAGNGRGGSRRIGSAAAAALTSPVLADDDRRDAVWLAEAAALRLTAAAWIAGAIVLWARLVGYGQTPIVPSLHDPAGPWLTTMTAAVVFPVVAVGLWLLGRWGLVVWAAAIAAGGTLFALRPDLVPFGPLGLGANIVVALAVAALTLLRLLRARRDGA